ncbi:hypothetical protein AN277_0203500 [Rothia kristinae]|uniref:Uncharacterized protein n=1 Tax=Rothia kristinae TaxID=37923 RepID=A0A199NU38_9MICC|nr:hypothetical protein AN277_0203500 [Rothia kristinae]
MRDAPAHVPEHPDAGPHHRGERDRQQRPGATPPSWAPIASTEMMTTPCRLRAEPMTLGCSTWCSTWFTMITTIVRTTAAAGPAATRATRAAAKPVTRAPTIGMNAPRKISAASGKARGTCITSIAVRSTIAAKAAMITVPRM